MSVEKLNDELEFAASQGPGVAIMTTQETVRAVLAEVGVIYVLADGCHVTGERAVDLYDDELARCKRVSSELAGCRADMAALAISHDKVKSALRALVDAQRAWVSADDHDSDARIRAAMSMSEDALLYSPNASGQPHPTEHDKSL